MIGIEILNPRTVVVMSILVTSIRIRGRNLHYVPQNGKFRPKKCKHEQETNVLMCLNEETVQGQMAENLQNPGESISILCQSPLVFSTGCIVVIHHLRQFLFCDCLILIHIGYLHLQPSCLNYQRLPFPPLPCLLGVPSSFKSNS